MIARFMSFYKPGVTHAAAGLLLLIAFPSHPQPTVAAGPTPLSSSPFDAARTAVRSPSWASPLPLELADSALAAAPGVRGLRGRRPWPPVLTLLLSIPQSPLANPRRSPEQWTGEAAPTAGRPLGAGPPPWEADGPVAASGESGVRPPRAGRRRPCSAAAAGDRQARGGRQPCRL